MKIGILTYHCVPNFGAQLQTLSTVEYLRKHGFETVVLNWYPEDLEAMYKNRISHIQIKAHEQFASQLLPLTKRYFNEQDVINEVNNSDIDGVVVGSDALFKYKPYIKRFCFSNGMIGKRQVLSVDCLKGNPFFGNFLSFNKCSVKGAAFSVSSQNCPYNSMTFVEKLLMKSALKNYSYISVRDKWTQKMIEEITGNHDIEITPDPVFSFNQNCAKYISSKETILKKYNLPEKYVLLSFSNWYIEHDYINKVINELERKGFFPIYLPMPEGSTKDTKKSFHIDLPLDPIDWYSLIKYSCGYIGERMHPIVVCLHNCIPFFCFDEYGIYRRKFLFSKRYVPESSKSYLIVKEAGLLENYYSYKTGSRLPDSDEVVKRLLQFDKDKCASFSELYQNKYEVCMQKVLDSI